MKPNGKQLQKCKLAEFFKLKTKQFILKNHCIHWYLLYIDSIIIF